MGGMPEKAMANESPDQVCNRSHACRSSVSGPERTERSAGTEPPIQRNGDGSGGIGASERPGRSGKFRSVQDGRVIGEA